MVSVVSSCMGTPVASVVPSCMGNPVASVVPAHVDPAVVNHVVPRGAAIAAAGAEDPSRERPLKQELVVDGQKLLAGIKRVRRNRKSQHGKPSRGIGATSRIVNGGEDKFFAVSTKIFRVCFTRRQNYILVSLRICCRMENGIVEDRTIALRRRMRYSTT